MHVGGIGSSRPHASTMTRGYRALRENAAWLDLSGRGKIGVRGPDRTRLIHALTTNDIRGLSIGEGCYTFVLNVQGKVIADANVFCLDDQLLLDTEPETRSTILSHIEEFTIAVRALGGNRGVLEMMWGPNMMSVPFTATAPR